MRGEAREDVITALQPKKRVGHERSGSRTADLGGSGGVARSRGIMQLEKTSRQQIQHLPKQMFGVSGSDHGRGSK